MESIIRSFLKERFGGLVADELFELHNRKLGIKNLDQLPDNQQIKMGQALIENISGQFSDARNLQNLKTLYLLRFALFKSAKNLESKLHEPCDMLLDPLKDVNQVEINQLAGYVADDEKTHFFYSVLDGALAMTLENEMALALAKYIMVNLQGIQPDNDELNDRKLSAITGLFQILISVFANIVGENQGKPMVFNLMETSDFRRKFLIEGDFVPSTVIQTNLIMKIGTERFKIGVVAVKPDSLDAGGQK